MLLATKKNDDDENQLWSLKERRHDNIPFSLVLAQALVGTISERQTWPMSGTVSGLGLRTARLRSELFRQAKPTPG
jgi:hypothetical protein